MVGNDLDRLVDLFGTRALQGESFFVGMGRPMPGHVRTTKSVEFWRVSCWPCQHFGTISGYEETEQGWIRWTMKTRLKNLVQI